MPGPITSAALRAAGLLSAASLVLLVVSGAPVRATFFPPELTPGQVDQLWILDIDGARLVIDAFSMPYATSNEREELRAVVESIRFER